MSAENPRSAPRLHCCVHKRTGISSNSEPNYSNAAESAYVGPHLGQTPFIKCRDFTSPRDSFVGIMRSGLDPVGLTLPIHDDDLLLQLPVGFRAGEVGRGVFICRLRWSFDRWSRIPFDMEHRPCSLWRYLQLGGAWAASYGKHK